MESKSKFSATGHVGIFLHRRAKKITCNRPVDCEIEGDVRNVSDSSDNDNDNDNDTLREVPHRSIEGLALQARVSGPWPHKKESVLHGKLAPWQGVQIQTVVDRV